MEGLAERRTARLSARGRRCTEIFAFVAALLIASPAPAPAQTIAIDRAACQRLVRHVPDADVAYQPGVDVSGKAVAPADLEGTPQMALPETVTIRLTSDLVKWLPKANFPYDKLQGSEVQLGIIAVTGDRVTYNGQPLTDAAQENLAVLCLDAKP